MPACALRDPHISLTLQGLCFGLFLAETEAAPERLWVPPGTRSVREREYFDAQFGPFYRCGLVSAFTRLTLTHVSVNQVIYVKKGDETGNAIDGAILAELNAVEQRVRPVRFHLVL